MSDLISKQSFINNLNLFLQKTFLGEVHRNNEISVGELCCLIQNEPIIQAEPVRYGQIIVTINKGRMKRTFSCCGTDCTTLTQWMIPNFCPVCGAKMKGTK